VETRRKGLEEIGSSEEAMAESPVSSVAGSGGG
jgi:hypothetical protein